MHASRWSPVLVVLLLAACQRTAVPDRDADAGQPPAPVSPAAQAPVPTGGQAAAPGFDCTQVTGEIEKAVCSDGELSALDHQLADTYAQALAKAADKATLQASQRGWIKGRGDCWKASDAAACVREAYIARITELRIDGGLVPAPKPVAFRCAGSDKPLTAVFYNEAPQAVVLSWGTDRAIVPLARSASGARYAARGVEFWEHQGEARVGFFGNQMTCTPLE